MIGLWCDVAIGLWCDAVIGLWCDVAIGLWCDVAIGLWCDAAIRLWCHGDSIVVWRQFDYGVAVTQDLTVVLYGDGSNGTLGIVVIVTMG